MAKCNQKISRKMIMYACVIGLCAGVVLHASNVYARISLTELKNQIAALQEQVDECTHTTMILRGTIIMWSGEIDLDGHPIIDKVSDTNWVICDGRPGTPDLSERFILGAGINHQPHEFGGSDKIELGNSNIPTHAHPINVQTEVDGDHRHVFSDKHWLANMGWVGGLGQGWRMADTSHFNHETNDENIHGERPQLHSHAIDGSTETSGEGEPYHHLPPFYTLTFLIYVGE